MKAIVVKVVQAKPFTNSHGTTIYHHLEMDNGDKIDIGKKKEVQVGDELDYEITERGQQEYNKAKSVMSQPPQGTQNGGGFKDNSDNILYQVCLKEAINVINIDGWGDNQEMSTKIKYLTDIAFQMASLSKDRINQLKAK